MTATKPAMAVILLGLGLANGWALSIPIEIAPIAAADAPADAAPAPSLEALDGPRSLPESAADLPQMLVRPIFRSDRRPPRAQAAEAGSAADQPIASQTAAPLPETLELVGIMTDGSGAGRALIRSGASPNGEWIGIGNMLDGWRLSRIEPDGILFEAGGQQQRLSLYPRKAQ